MSLPNVSCTPTWRRSSPIWRRVPSLLVGFLFVALVTRGARQTKNGFSLLDTSLVGDDDRDVQRHFVEQDGQLVRRASEIRPSTSQAS